ncbi:ZIP family metal transporter [Halostagnicola sp. A-GB9-2]|uniref:ZIP family metal transporter n=1 Tax=Halostagnicola sp. A-GB9-2 TaxID=3048066 RepID=UPI0024BFB0B7|nr:ZIP family metal transporter [Halostagnicola sp. A-GB9-2]MDJ1431196.1 ZIP family metal transporter [Halostagnicola sp. A-GB9-2]
MSEFVTMLVVTAVAGAVTGLGALPVFFRATVTHRVYDAALGLAAGIMVGASVFGLILPGMDEGGLEPVVAGVFLGGLVLLAGNQIIPHLHVRFTGWRHEGSVTPAGPDSSVRRALLIGGAIVLHNAPEGLAIGVAFASGFQDVAYLLAVVIGLQNIPDGFAFAVPFGETGVSNAKIFLYTTLSGLVPQVGAAIFGYVLVVIAAGLFPVAAGFAAGAMLAVVFREMIPSSHGHGYADAATSAFIVGFVLLVIVDELLVV